MRTKGHICICLMYACLLRRTVQSTFFFGARERGEECLKIIFRPWMNSSPPKAKKSLCQLGSHVTNKHEPRISNDKPLINPNENTKHACLLIFPGVLVFSAIVASIVCSRHLTSPAKRQGPVFFDVLATKRKDWKHLHALSYRMWRSHSAL